MANTLPISEFRDYDTVLKVFDSVSVDEPVYISGEAQKGYAIVDMTEYKKMKASIWLINELEKARRSRETEGTVSHEEVWEMLKRKRNEA